MREQGRGNSMKRWAIKSFCELYSLQGRLSPPFCLGVFHKRKILCIDLTTVCMYCVVSM